MATTPEEFIPRYERALATQDWSVVDPLIHEDACVTFSAGTVHVGKDAVRKAFERNFSAISGEEYRISNIHWVRHTDDVAIYLFDFKWAGQVNGQAVGGSGHGTCVLLHNNVTGWRLLIEHLGPGAS